MTRECQFQATAQGAAVQRRDHRLGARLGGRDDLTEVRRLHRPAELAHVGAGAEEPPPAYDHERPGGRHPRRCARAPR